MTKCLVDVNLHELSSTIKHRIHSRTHGRIWNLHVEFAEQSVVLHGRTSTYYTKQLAQHGAQEIVGSHAILNQIEVRKVA
jgi:hypothetical protein